MYITSDTHYNHKNICSAVTEWKDTRPGQTRDFKSLSHMNQTIVNNINAVVGEDDILIHFGDFSFGGIEQIWEFRKQIVCKYIYLIFGNHDEHIIANKQLMNLYKDPENCKILEGDFHENHYSEYKFGEYWSNEVYTQDLFTWCGHYEEFEIVYPQEGKNQKKLRYTFVASHFPFASWNKMGRGRVHFHGHVHLDKQHKIHQGRSMDIGVDGNDFKPYELKEAFKLIENNPITNTILIEDHHIGD